MSSFLSLLARLMLAAVFIGSGVEKLLDAAGTVKVMQAEGVPSANLLYFGAVAFLLVGGLLLALGLFARFGSLLLMIFLALATYYFHDFWNMPADADPQAVKTQQIAFMKNVAIFGGLLMVFANGPGGLSADRRRLVRRETVVVKKRAASD